MRFALTILATTLTALAATVAPPRDLVERRVEAGLAYLRQAQNPDGSFGSIQRRFQTGLAILAFLSSGATPARDADSPVPGAVAWLLENTGEDGFLGDSEYPMESSAVAALALSEALGMVGDPALEHRLGERVEAAVELALRQQDRAAGAEYYGGWKASAKEKINDRRVTAWYLLLLHSARLRGHRVADRALERALDFMEGSQKLPDGSRALDPADVGGFSYDAAGLPIVSISGAGLACLSIYDRPEKRRDLALDWLRRNRPIWYGPNFYYAYVFAARGMAREEGHAPDVSGAFFARIWELLNEHQNPDGSFQIPPGNAENTQAMGKTYGTAMAILIFNAKRNLIPVDARP